MTIPEWTQMLTEFVKQRGMQVHKRDSALKNFASGPEDLIRD